jgi:hypothetical protein
MAISVNVAADQLAQYWDGYICETSKELSKISPMSRYHMALFTFEMIEVLKVERLDNDKWFDLSERTPEWMKKLGTSEIRRVIDDAEVSTDQSMRKYVESLMEAIKPKAIENCLRALQAILGMIAKGDADVIGWDAKGNLEFSITRQGAMNTGARQGKVFLSVIGRMAAGQYDPLASTYDRFVLRPRGGFPVA